MDHLAPVSPTYVVWGLISGEYGPRLVGHVVHERVVIIFTHSVEVPGW